MTDKPPRRRKRRRPAGEPGSAPAAGVTAGASGGRAWKRPANKGARRAAAPADLAAAGRRPDRSPAGEAPDGSAAGSPRSTYRMRLSEAAEQEARAFEERRTRLRGRRLRPWLSALFLLAALSFVLYLAGLVLALVQAPDLAVVVCIAAFAPGAFACWLLALVCSVRLRDWLWLAALGLGPFLVAALAGLLTLPALFVYPLPSIIGGLIYPWSKRLELFAEPEDR